MAAPDSTSQLDAPPVGGAAGSDAPARSRRGRRWLVVVAAVVVLALVGLAGFLLGDRGGDPVVAPQEPDTTTSPPGSWVSGASGNDVASGDFGRWRGRTVELAAAFADDNQRMVDLDFFQPGGEYESWQGSMDVAIGALSDEESWADAADGDYDDRWRESLEGLAEAWEGREGTMYIRFAHELNGRWYPWAVTDENLDDFRIGWERFRDLQQEVFPESQLVFCVAKRTSGENDLDWRDAFPDEGQVDVLSVDYYNQSPHVATQEEWDESLTEVDDRGAPVGMEQYRDFAEERGVPLAVSEWNNNADESDAPVYMEQMHAFFDANGGTGAGDLLYESVFNRTKEENRWLLYGEGVRMPESSEAYQRLF